MKKKVIASLFILVLVFGYSGLNAAEIKGKVFTSSDGKPYTKGAVLLKAPDEEKYIKAEIGPEGNYSFREVSIGTYTLKLDLYGLTPAEKEIEIKEQGEILNVDLPISHLLATKVFLTPINSILFFTLSCSFILLN